MRPTPRGVLVFAAGLVVALLPVVVQSRLWTAWPLFLGFSAVAFGVDALAAPRRRSVTQELGLPDTLSIGDRGVATVRVRLAARWAARVEVLLDLNELLRPAPVVRERIANGDCEIAVTLVPVRRGTARVETVWVRYTGPLGLVGFTRRFRVDREIPIIANTSAMRAVAVRWSNERENRIGLKVERFRGDGTEFDSLRDFVVGDDTRSLSWKATARHRRLLCRQYRAERNHQLIVAVDTGRLMSETLDGIPKLDHALSAALLLAYVGLRTGDRVGLVAFDAHVRLFLEPQGGVRAHAVITRMSSRIEYSDLETNYTLGLTTLSQRIRRRSLVVVLTDFIDTVTAELMVENLSRLARRHLVVFVALRDPGLDRVAATRPVDTMHLNRAVVAHGFIRDRDVVLARLRRMGILAIDAAPRRIGTELINCYLDVKRRERV